MLGARATGRGGRLARAALLFALVGADDGRTNKNLLVSHRRPLSIPVEVDGVVRRLEWQSAGDDPDGNEL